jgi:hypothetical protein
VRIVAPYPAGVKGRLGGVSASPSRSASPRRGLLAVFRLRDPRHMIPSQEANAIRPEAARPPRSSTGRRLSGRTHPIDPECCGIGLFSGWLLNPNPIFSRLSEHNHIQLNAEHGSHSSVEADACVVESQEFSSRWPKHAHGDHCESCNLGRISDNDQSQTLYG